MVANKEKVNKVCVRAPGDAQPRRNMGLRNFKIYSDNGKGKVTANSNTNTSKSGGENLVPARGTSAPSKRGALLTSLSNPKGSLKIVENITGKHNKSETQIFRRRALADVSNVQKNLKNAVREGSKSLISGGPGSKIANLSSRKSSMEKTGDAPNQYFNTTKRGVKDMRASLGDRRTNTKNNSHEFAVNNGRRCAGDSVVLVRKSLPILKRTSLTATSNSKGNDKSSKKANQISGFPVKSQVSRKVASQLSIVKSHLLRNRASDGLVMMASKDKNKVDPLISSRNSIRSQLQPKIKSTIKSKVDRTSRFKSISSMKKPTKKEEESVISSIPENITDVISHEVTHAEASADGNNKTTNEISDANVKRRSSRRRSYTSLLMSRPKLLGEHVIDQEKLQSIDDNCNQLEVAEYVDEIYQYYWVSEAQNIPLANYMSIQIDLAPQMRDTLINWLVEVHYKFDLMQETLYLTVTLLDRYLSQVQIKKNELQLVGLTALLLASKYEDFWHPRIKDLISISAESYTRHQLLAMEMLFLKKLKFRLNEPTPYVFMLRFLKAAQSDTKLERMAFYLIELCLVEYEALKFKPSLLCASAIYVARSTLQITPAWTPLLSKHARYEVSEIRDCAEMILRFHKAAGTTRLKVTYEKYTSHKLSRVAAIKPLDKLPH